MSCSYGIDKIIKGHNLYLASTQFNWSHYSTSYVYNVIITHIHGCITYTCTQQDMDTRPNINCLIALVQVFAQNK